MIVATTPPQNEKRVKFSRALEPANAAGVGEERPTPATGWFLYG
jgi:hypothetical protein